MYRIVFDPDTAKWVIQLKAFGLFWRRIKTNPLGFENYDLAASYVENVGLDKVYRNYHRTAVAEIFAGGHPMESGYQPMPQVLRTRRA